MNIALIGYGRMGHEIETIALNRGHIIKLIIDQDNTADLCESNLTGIDVAIEFSTPDTAYENVSVCLESSVPVVSGTTGWLDDYEKATEICKRKNTSFIHSTNYSIGVNLFFRLNEVLSRLISGYSNYSCSIEEIHHIKKLDAPSGTAITLATGIINNTDNYSSWCFENNIADASIPIRSVREGNCSGYTHCYLGFGN